jgi:single-strand DNA-binding protein
MYINKALIYGNLTRDPELKSLPSGSQVAEFSVATNRVWKDKNGAKQESVDFHNIVLFGKQAELAKQYLHKGNGVFIEGRIQTRSWEGDDKVKRYRTEIVADRLQFGPKSGSTPGNYSAPAKSEEPKQKSEEIEYPEEEINADDIPF